MKRILLAIPVLLFIALISILVFAPAIVDGSKNPVIEHAPYVISPQAQALHDSLIIGDWHADSLLWKRDLVKRNNVGHVDLPRLQQGNVGLQMFTVVTKSPKGLNVHQNDADAIDFITNLILVQLWPVKTLNSLTERALHQAKKLHTFAGENPNDLMIIKSKSDLALWYEKRQSNPKLIGGLLGTEGSHALNQKLSNVQVLFDRGFRMMSLQHFFDNKLGGSLHGQEKAGLSEFGQQVVERINQLGIILDVSHSSQRVVEDILNLNVRPLVVSHTGFKGHCDTERNIPDALIQKIAAKGGLIAVGYWSLAVCGTTPNDIAGAIRYGIELVGEDHVALGSDFDGAVETALDASELAAITQALMDINVSEQQIRKVMGDNMLRLLTEQLPD